MMADAMTHPTPGRPLPLTTEYNNAIESTLLDLVTRYGYLVVFIGVGAEAIGIPLPGETALLVGVVAASTGHLSLAGVMATAWCSATLGGSLGYVVGRRWGTRIMAVPGLRRVYRPERIAAADRLVERFGLQTVFAGRFIPLLRIFAGPLAGMHRLPWRRYLVANTSGAAVWVAAVSVVGVLIGDNLGRAVAVVERSGYVAFVVAVLVVVAIAVHHRRNA